MKLSRRSLLAGLLGATAGIILPEPPRVRAYSFLPRNVPGIAAIDSTFLINGILQTDILAHGVGTHVFCEPMAFETMILSRSDDLVEFQKAVEFLRAAGKNDDPDYHYHCP